jgi:hypothetical protein
LLLLSGDYYCICTPAFVSFGHFSVLKVPVLFF